ARLNIEAPTEAERFEEGVLLEAIVRYQDAFIASTAVAVTRKQVNLQIDVCSNPGEHEWSLHSWSSENLQLYDLELRIIKDGKPEDTVLSYFGMRDIRIDGRQILLNGSPLYQRLILDQGYWEDSHLTPPDEAALIEDIEKIQKLGYNGVRKHQKIED